MKQNKKSRTPIRGLPKLKAELQKEIGSRCPFCLTEDIGHFHIHHIDENPNNHDYKNLLLICQNCHSKFTKNEWPFSKARQQKDEYLKLPYFRLLESDPIDAFDYQCYDMKSSNGRLAEEDTNGSIVNIKVTDPFNLKITLKQSDGRIWKGEVKLKTKNYGELFFIYESSQNEIEVGRRECFIFQEYDIKNRVDKLFLKSLSDHKDYGNELIQRMVNLQP